MLLEESATSDTVVVVFDDVVSGVEVDEASVTEVTLEVEETTVGVVDEASVVFVSEVELFDEESVDSVVDPVEESVEDVVSYVTFVVLDDEATEVIV